MPVRSTPWHGFRSADTTPSIRRTPVEPRPESLEPLRCLSTGKTVIYHTPYSLKYAAAGDGSLTDGLRGGWNYGDRRWLGWLDTDVDLVVDLGERQPVRRIAADFMQGFYADIWMPRAVEFSVSDDNERFTPLATVGNDIPVEFKQDCYREFGWTGQTEARYVRLKARHQRPSRRLDLHRRNHRRVTRRVRPFCEKGCGRQAASLFLTGP